MSAAPECLLVLASASPRRRRLVTWLGVPFEFMAVDTPEDLDSFLVATPERLASHLAAEKAVAATALRPPADSEVLIAFDTIVVLDGEVLGKPVDVPDAWRMLRALSGRTHDVVTGVAVVVDQTRGPHTFAVTTKVRMKALGDREIEAWMAAGEFMGCAGAYNIEGQVAEVDDEECYQNVAGLPLCHVHAVLASADAPCELASRLTSPVSACDAALARRCRLGPRVVGERSIPHASQ